VDTGYHRRDDLDIPGSKFSQQTGHSDVLRDFVQLLK